MSSTPHAHSTPFSPSTKSRLTLLDAVKVAAMIMMMQGHTIDALVRPDEMNLTEFPGLIWQHLRGFTAPIFLSVSGMLFALTMQRSPSGRMRMQQAWLRIRWALVLMATAYVLVFPASNIFHLSFVSPAGWTLFFQANILQLNALALILTTCIALVTTSEKSFRVVCYSISAILVFATPFVNAVDWFNMLPEGVAAFLSYRHGSYFPIAPFASYMMFGAALGTSLRSVPRDIHHDYLRDTAWKIGATMLLVGVVLYLVDPLFSWMPQLDVLQSMPSTVFLREGVVLVLISFIALAQNTIRRFRRPLELFGKQSLVIYLIHLVILFGTPWYSSFGRIFFKQLSLGAGIMLSVMVVSSTLLVVWFENELSHRFRRTHRILQGLVLAYVLFGLLF